MVEDMSKEEKKNSYSKAFEGLSFEEFKKDLDYFMKKEAVNIIDKMIWLLHTQNKYLETTEEGKKAKEGLYKEALEIIKDILPVIDKYAVGNSFNGFLFAIFYLLGCIHENNMMEEIYRALIMLGQEEKKTAGRKDIAYG